MAKPVPSKQILTVLLLFIIATMVSVSVAQLPGNIGPAQGRKITLRQQLTVGLKAFSKADKAFIDKVVAAVDQGKLSRKLVDSTFLWARNRAEQRSYARSLRPMVYFQPGMILRAKRVRVKL